MAKLTDLIKRDISLGKLPQFLFKYRTIDGTLEKIIENGTLWFAKPLSFNDPFDCQIQVDTQNTIAEIRDYIKRTSPKIDKDHLKLCVDGIVADPEYWPKIVKGAITRAINSKGICCFSTHNKSILMWSHYTNCHTGVSLKFDVSQDPDFFIHPMKVEYTKVYPKYNHIRDSANLVKLLIQSKSDIWKYEDEFRILKSDIGIHAFNKKALIEVTFGANCEKKDADRVRKLFLKNGYDHTLFKKATVSQSSYQLKISDF
jgi:hypothetical protein